MKLAQIEGGIIVNMIEVDEAAIPDWAKGWPEAGAAEIGWVQGKGGFTAPDTSAADLASIRARRDAAISASITIAGMQVQTDDLSQQRITGAALAAVIDPATTVNWKVANGQFVTLDAPTIITIAQAVRAHVQACFDAEAKAGDLLSSGKDLTESDLDTIFGIGG